MPTPTLIHMAYERKRKRIYATSLDENKVYVLDAKAFSVIRKVPVALHPIYVYVDENTNTLFVVCDFGVYGYDLQTFKEKENFNPRMAPADAVLSTRLHKIFMCGYATSLPFRVLSMFNGSLVKKRLGWLPPFSLFCSACSLADEENVVFVSMPLQGKVYMYRADTSSLITWFYVPKGIRRMAYSPSHKRLYAGNYITGNLEVIDPFAQKVVNKIFVGKRIRDVFYSHATKKVYVASSLGFFEVSPE